MTQKLQDTMGAAQNAQSVVDVPFELRDTTSLTAGTRLKANVPKATQNLTFVTDIYISKFRQTDHHQ